MTMIIWSHPVGDIVPSERGGGGEALRFAAIAGHDVDLGVAVILGGEGELLPVRRKMRERAVARAARQAAGHTSVFRNGVKLAGVTENDRFAVGRRETQKRVVSGGA